MKKVNILIISWKFCRFFGEAVIFWGWGRLHTQRYQPQGKFIFQQLISNFADFQRKNTVFQQNKIMLLKNVSHEKNLYFFN